MWSKKRQRGLLCEGEERSRVAGGREKRGGRVGFRFDDHGREGRKVRSLSGGRKKKPSVILVEGAKSIEGGGKGDLGLLPLRGGGEELGRSR